MAHRLWIIKRLTTTASSADCRPSPSIFTLKLKNCPNQKSKFVAPNNPRCNLTKGGYVLYDAPMNKKPPELHLVDGTTPRKGMPTAMPDNLKKRIPRAEWVDNPEAWNKALFIEETANFLYEVYGIGNDQDKHTLAMLADHIETYIKCTRMIEANGIITRFNNGQTVGPNPYLTVRNKTMTLIIQLMNEMGLTPRSRLSAGKIEEDSPVSQFLKGPLAQ